MKLELIVELGVGKLKRSVRLSDSNGERKAEGIDLIATAITRQQLRQQQLRIAGRRNRMYCSSRGNPWFICIAAVLHPCSNQPAASASQLESLCSHRH